MLHGDLAHDADGKRWLLSGIAPHIAIRLKNVFPRLDKTATRTFAFPDTDEGCRDLDWFLHRYPMRVGEVDATRLAAGVLRFDERQAEAQRILGEAWAPGAVPAGFKPDRAPYPNQERSGVECQITWAQGCRRSWPTATNLHRPLATDL